LRLGVVARWRAARREPGRGRCCAPVARSFPSEPRPFRSAHALLLRGSGPGGRPRARPPRRARRRPQSHRPRALPAPARCDSRAPPLPVRTVPRTHPHPGAPYGARRGGAWWAPAPRPPPSKQTLPIMPGRSERAPARAAGRPNGQPGRGAGARPDSGAGRARRAAAAVPAARGMRWGDDARPPAPRPPRARAPGPRAARVRTYCIIIRRSIAASVTRRRPRPIWAAGPEPPAAAGAPPGAQLIDVPRWAATYGSWPRCWRPRAAPERRRRRRARRRRPNVSAPAPRGPRPRPACGAPKPRGLAPAPASPPWRPSPPARAAAQPTRAPSPSSQTNTRRLPPLPPTAERGGAQPAPAQALPEGFQPSPDLIPTTGGAAAAGSTGALAGGNEAAARRAARCLLQAANKALQAEPAPTLPFPLPAPSPPSVPPRPPLACPATDPALYAKVQRQDPLLFNSRDTSHLLRAAVAFDAPRVKCLLAAAPQARGRRGGLGGVPRQQ
jgi:hypothetical protein